MTLDSGENHSESPAGQVHTHSVERGFDPEEAIVRAVNDTKDNDTVAAIVGAAVGALHGEAALPARWKAGLLGCTRESDDGRVFDLLREARATFWEGRP